MLEKLACSSATECIQPSRPGSWSGSKLWSTKSGARSSSRTSRSPLACASKKRRTRALFSSVSDTEASSLPSHVFLPDRQHHYDATRRPLAHRLEVYSASCLEGVFSEVRGHGVLRSSFNNN